MEEKKYTKKTKRNFRQKNLTSCFTKRRTETVNKEQHANSESQWNLNKLILEWKKRHLYK